VEREVKSHNVVFVFQTCCQFLMLQNPFFWVGQKCMHFLGYGFVAIESTCNCI
jgi:hypothetical protein